MPTSGKRSPRWSTAPRIGSPAPRSLERKGLIERELDTVDTRARRLRVPRRGAALAPRAIAIVEDVDARFFADLSERETLRFLRRLVKVPEAAVVRGVAASSSQHT